MSKNTINYLLLTFGAIILLFGFIDFGVKSAQNEFNVITFLLIFAGVFIISKILRKTKDLPSREFKERLKDKD